MELISREEVERLLIKWFTQCTEEEFFDLKKAVDELPTIESRPKGKWRKGYETQPNLHECSVCGNVIYSEHDNDIKVFHKFCGKCGADMRGKE